jgi:hypothetical protein
MGKGNDLFEHVARSLGLGAGAATLRRGDGKVFGHFDGPNHVRIECTRKEHQGLSGGRIQICEGGRMTVNQRPTIVLMVQDLQPTKDEEEFFTIFQKVFDKFVEKNRKRHGIWRRSGVAGQVHEIFQKAERAYMEAYVSREVPDPDHFQDVIVYSIFCLILMEKWEHPEGEAPADLYNRVMYGEWPRPA